MSNRMVFVLDTQGRSWLCPTQHGRVQTRYKLLLCLLAENLGELINLFVSFLYLQKGGQKTPHLPDEII